MGNLMVVYVVAQLKMRFVLLPLILDPVIHEKALTHVEIGKLSIQPAFWGQPYMARFVHINP